MTHPQFDWSLLEHWFLSIFINHPCQVSWLLPEPRTEALNIHPFPGFRAPDYRQALLSMIEKGWLEFPQSPGYQHLENPQHPYQPFDHGLCQLEDFHHRRPMQWTMTEVRAALDDPQFNGSVALTSAGGGQWEQLAHPDWSRYYDYSCLPHFELERTFLHLASQNKDRLMVYLGWCETFHGERPDLATVHWEFHERFPVTYWKELPNVWCLRFEAHQLHQERNALLPGWMREWEVQWPWYTQPWDTPAWKQREQSMKAGSDAYLGL